MKNKARLPTIGRPVRGSKTGRPIMVALDLLGRRGCLRVLWELREKSLTFRVLQAAAATNPALLNTRLKELRAAGIVEHSDAGYHLTHRGRELEQVLESLSEWANRWGEGLEGGES
jgi:DNA-binding HxlR family transcriptional regulator